MPPVGYKQQIIAAMPGTPAEIATRANVTVGTARRWLRIMHEADECHIVAWGRTVGTGGSFKAVWRAGKGKDKQLPKALGQVEYSRRHRKKIKQDERGESRTAARSARYYADKAQRFGSSDPLLNALFGRGT